MVDAPSDPSSLTNPVDGLCCGAGGVFYVHSSSFVCLCGRREVRSKTVMCGMSDAVGVELGTDPVVTVISERGKRPGVALTAGAASIGEGRRDARCWCRVVAESP